MDTNRIRELLDQRDKIDAEIVAVINNGTSVTIKRPIKCGNCDEIGHTARTCPTKQQ